MSSYSQKTFHSSVSLWNFFDSSWMVFVSRFINLSFLSKLTLLLLKEKARAFQDLAESNKKVAIPLSIFSVAYSFVSPYISCINNCLR